MPIDLHTAFRSLDYSAADPDTVLNPGLLTAMKRTLTGVRVINPGQPLEGYYDTHPATGRRHLRIVRRGETIVADCLFCGDSRQRLSVNHRYGVKDPVTGFNGYELWKCYNEECQHEQRFRLELRDLLSVSYLVAKVRTEPVRRVDKPTLMPCEFPGVLASLSTLPTTHPAIAYLLGRKPPFDPLALERDYGIAYAEHVPARNRGAMAQGRLVIPVVHGGVMVGWQARYPGELDWKASGVPKYLTYFMKSLAVYGIDSLDAAPAGVMVEGVTDVWRYGPGAFCGFGKSLSAAQAELVAARLKDRPLVLVPDQDDPDSEPEFKKAAALCRRHGHTGDVLLARLPSGSDPGKLPAAELHRLVAAATPVRLPPPGSGGAGW